MLAASLAGAAPAVDAQGAGGPVRVNETEFKLTPRTLQATQGIVAIVVTDAGNSTHSFAVENHGEKGHAHDPHLKRPLSPGQSATLHIRLKPGRYEIYCPIPGHESLGMRGALLVQ